MDGTDTDPPHGLETGLWIRIRMDSHHFPSWILIQYADPDPKEKDFQIKTEKMQANW